MGTFEEALALAEQGIPVFPCAYGKKTPATGNGFKDATTVPRQIEAWFCGKQLNLAIPTGKVSGRIVIDDDSYREGGSGFEALVAELGPLPETFTVQTRAGGRQYHFVYPKGFDIGCSAGAVASHVDIRGDGGYVMMPPSWAEADDKGRAGFYTVEKDSPLAELPPAWAKRLASPKREKKEQGKALDDLKGGFTMPEDGSIVKGQRNSELTRIAGYYKNRGISGDPLAQVLRMANRTKCTEPLDEAEVVKIAQSIDRYESKAPPAIDDDWPEPREIAESLPPVPPFDERLVPGKLRRMIYDVAERMCCPVEFPAVACMVALGSVIGAKVHCRPYEKGTWLVPANTWAMLVSPPGAIKTPPVAEVLRPLRVMDERAAKEYAEAMREYQIKMMHHEKQVKQQVVTNLNGALALVPPVEPRQTRYIVNDSTYEMLVAIAAQNPNGFLVWRDELAGWFHSLEKENQKEARGLYLTGWSGTEGYATDRIGRGHTRAEKVVLSLMGTIQPGVLKGIIHDAVSGGAGDDGLSQRFQLMVYPDPVKEWKKVDRYPDMEATQHFEQLINRLANADPRDLSAGFTLDGTAYLPFDGDAQRFFDAWRERLERRIRSQGNDEHPAMLAHLSKYRSLVPKLALILHLATNGKGPITRNAVVRAVAWARLLEDHARRIYGTATNRAVACASALANKIKAGKLKNGFTRSDVLLKEWANLRTAEEVGLALTVLRDMGWLMPIEDRSRSGRPAERYYINPKVKQAT